MEYGDQGGSLEPRCFFDVKKPQRQVRRDAVRRSGGRRLGLVSQDTHLRGSLGPTAHVS